MKFENFEWVETMEKAAVSSSRIISENEMTIRKTIGVIGMIAVAMTLVLYPSSRDSYASMSLMVAMSVGIWRTGYQAL